VDLAGLYEYLLSTEDGTPISDIKSSNPVRLIEQGISHAAWYFTTANGKIPVIALNGKLRPQRYITRYRQAKCLMVDTIHWS